MSLESAASMITSAQTIGAVEEKETEASHWLTGFKGLKIKKKKKDRSEHLKIGRHTKSE